MAWLIHTWRIFARRHAALPALAVSVSLLVVALVAVLVVGVTADDADPSDGAGETEGPGDAETSLAFLDGLPSSCVDADDERCSVSTGALGLVADTGAVVVTDTGVVEVSGAVTIPTAGGGVELGDSDLVIEVDDDGEIIDIGGTADAPLPTTGPFAAAAVIDGARAEVGYDWGRNLTDLGAHLDPDRQYFSFRFSDTFAMRTGFDDLFGDAAALPVSLSAPGDVSVTMVLDPIDPYFYIGGACPDFVDDDSDGAGDGDSDGGTNRDADGDAAEVTVGEGEGEDCGLGVSFGGNIPFQARVANGASDDLQAFSGHVVIAHSEIPVASGVMLDGEMVVRLGTSALGFGGNGEVFATVPLFDDVLDLSVPLGDASTGLQVALGRTGGAADVFVSGILDSARAFEDLPAWLPVAPAQGQTLEATARLVVGGGDQLLGAESFVEMTGAMRAAPGFLSDLTGVTLGPVDATEAVLRIDPTGVRLAGTTTSSVHPAIDATGEMVVDAFLSPTEPETSVVELVGAAGIGEVGLDGDATLRLSGAGVEAVGALATPVRLIEMSGAITDTAIDLRGTARVEVPVSGIAGLLDGVPRTLADAREAVTEVDAEIDRVRSEIVERRQQAIADARAVLDGAQRAADDVRRAVDGARGDLADLEDDLDEVIDDILDRFPLWDDVTDVVDRLIPRSLRDARDRIEDDIDDVRGDIDGLLDDRRIADAALARATAGLDEIEQEHIAIGVDADPRVLALVATRETLVLALDAAEGVSSIVTIDALVALDIEVRIGSQGVSGDVVGAACSDAGCLEVVGGSVNLGLEPEACFTLVGVEACVPF